MSGAAPVGDAEFAAAMARLGPWSQGRHVAVAVSGGADSLCLAWLAHRWGDAIGLIVDHGLRDGSAGEAAAAAAALVGFGMSARGRRIALSPGPALAARARDARYAALSGLARADGLVDVLVGHHVRDQAETLLIRREARSRAAGLSAMAAVVETADIRVVRPLLGIAPERLRATLREAGVGWSEDPTNADAAAPRVRYRWRLDDPEDGGYDAAGLAAEAAGSGIARREAEALAAAILAERVAIYPEGYALLSPGPIDAAVFSALLRALTGAPHPARGAGVDRLVRDMRPATVAGVELLPAGKLGNGWLMLREAAAMSPAVPALPGVVWDRRFSLANAPSVGPDATLGALGADAAGLRDATTLPSAVLRTTAAVRCGGRVVGVNIGGHPAFMPGILFSPAVPLAGAGFSGSVFR